MTRLLAVVVLLAPACWDGSTLISADGDETSTETKPGATSPGEVTSLRTEPKYYAPVAVAAELLAEDFDPRDESWELGADIVTVTPGELRIEARHYHDHPECKGTPAGGRLLLDCNMGTYDASWEVQPDGSVLTDLMSLIYSRERAEERLAVVPAEIPAALRRAASAPGPEPTQIHRGRYQSAAGGLLVVGQDGVVTLNGEELETQHVGCYARRPDGSIEASDSRCLVVGNGNPAMTSYVWSEGWVAAKVVEDAEIWGVLVKADAERFLPVP